VVASYVRISWTGDVFHAFFVQWLYSEKHKKSVIPLSFWYFSIAGSVFLLIYAVLRRDVVFTLGQTTGFIIYLRNIYFVVKERKNICAKSL